MDLTSFILGLIIGVLFVFGLEPTIKWAIETVKRLKK